MMAQADTSGGSSGAHAKSPGARRTLRRAQAWAVRTALCWPLPSRQEARESVLYHLAELFSSALGFVSKVSMSLLSIQVLRHKN